MDEFIKWSSYGAAGVAAYVVAHLIKPIITASIHRNKAESTIYENAKDMIDFTNRQYAELQQRFAELEQQLMQVEKELQQERTARKELQRELNKLKGESHGA